MESLTELFCLIDDFCRRFAPAWEQHQLTAGTQRRRRRGALSLSELMTLVVLFHQLRFRQFKRFYLDYARRHLRDAFPTLPSYPRCVELLPRCARSWPPGSRHSKDPAMAYPSSTRPRSRSVTTGASPGIGSSRTALGAARPPWI